MSGKEKNELPIALNLKSVNPLPSNIKNTLTYAKTNLV